MAEKESHAIRNGAIAGIISGLVLFFAIPITRAIAFGLLHWFKKTLLSFWGWILTNHNVPGWLILVWSLLSLVALMQIINVLRPAKVPDYISFTQMNHNGVVWRWQWLQGTIQNLWCFCPSCDAELVKSEPEELRSLLRNQSCVDLVCENCDGIIAHINGGGLSYALENAKREIRRRLRTEKYKHEQNTLA